MFALLLLCGGGKLVAATPAEDRAFAAAVRSFTNNIWDFAEAELAQFVEKNPQSPYVSDAILLQAQAQFQQRKYAPAVALLTAHLGHAGKITDKYFYWIGEAQFANTNYPAAMEAFGRLVNEFTNSTLRVEARVREADSAARLSQWARVTELLKKPDGAFQQSAKAKPDSEFSVRGFLLWAEAELQQDHFAEADVALTPVKERALAKPELEWRKQFLICRLQAGSGKLPEALASTTNLLAAAETTRLPEFMADSVAFRAGILERLGQLDQARATYELNLTNAPPERQRQALSKIADLALSQNQLADAIQKLELSFTRFSNAPSADKWLLTLGELQLRQSIALAKTNATASSNLLAQSLGNFDRLITTFSNSPLAGKAALNKGWCFWITQKFPESTEAFRLAATRLPPSADLAVARYKLADTLYLQQDFAGALENYRSAIDVSAQWPQVKDALGPSALYQILRASLKLQDLASATNAMQKILEAYPHNDAAPGSVLLVGQGLADANDPGAARELFDQFVALWPTNHLRPVVELAIARTAEQKSNWAEAIAHYDSWLERFATNALRPQAEYYRAQAYFHSDNETNAMAGFTNFTARFPDNPLAPLAQWWLADYHWRLGEYRDAEFHFKTLFQNWPQSEQAYDAIMMAGKAAVGWAKYENATNYFKRLTSDQKCPANLRIQATFAYSDVYLLMDARGTNRAANLIQAVQLLDTIPQLHPNTEQAERARGAIGNAFLQLAAEDASYYSSASNAYQQVVSSPHAEISTRSQAMVGLGQVAEALAATKTGGEKSALLIQARNYYIPVYHETILREGEQSDKFWLKQAALKLLQVAEQLKQWDTVESVGLDLQKTLPPLKTSLEKTIANARRQKSSEKN